ncbi:hypothetical protein HA402_009578 [Bradysia odoriphaga]|nr:hypothetical protein HA402_009578 [Bradysia odoriphaga]
MKVIVTLLCLVALSCALPVNELPLSIVTVFPDSVAFNDSTVLPELNKENEGNANRKTRDIIDTPTPALVISPSGGVGIPLGPNIAISAGPNPSNPGSPPEVFPY